MSTKDQTELEKEMSEVLGRLESRVVKLGKSGLKYFTGVCRDILNDFKAARKSKDDAIYKELMAAESEAKALAPSDASKKVLDCIYRAKGLLILALALLNVFQITVVTTRLRPNGGEFGLRAGIRFECLIRKKEAT